MKQHKRWRCLLALTLVLALVIAVPVQAKEPVSDGNSTDAIEDDRSEKSENVNNYEKGVWLHVVNGNFTGDYKNKASVWVDFEAGRNLPCDSEMKKYEPTRTGGTFKGWYTKAPTEELQAREDGGEKYSVWHTVKTNGEEVACGSEVPEEVQVLYAVFEDKKETDTQEGDKLITYYLDWNGIDGMFGHCLTCTRGYKKEGIYFTPEDAAVYSLNFDGEDKKKFEDGSSGKGKWEILKEIWGQKEYNGYTFKGWSTTPDGEPFWENQKVTDGMSFYAVWEKSGESNKTFKREDPAAGPLQFVRIEGSGLSASLSACKHAKVNESFVLTMSRSPVRAAVKEVVWDLTISKGLFKTEKKTVSAGQECTAEGLVIKAEGCALTITNTDGKEHGLTVGVTAKGDSGQPIAAPANATVSFAHTWDKGTPEGTPTCEKGTTVEYTCTAEGCNATKEEKISPLEHVYEKGIESDRCRTILKAPTCTEDGIKRFNCLRPGCEDKDGPTVTIPALGHDWKETVTPADCTHNTVTKVCQREGCHTTETSLVSADNPELHRWKTTNVSVTCKNNIIDQKCEVCQKTRTLLQKSSAPDAHKWSTWTVPANCSMNRVISACEYCGIRREQTVRAKNAGGPHVWGEWETIEKATFLSAGKEKRTCRLCDAEETRVTAQLVIDRPKTEEKTEDKTEQTAEEKAKQEAEQTEEKAGQETEQTAKEEKAEPETEQKAEQETKQKTVQKTEQSVEQNYSLYSAQSPAAYVNAEAQTQEISVGKVTLSSVKKSGKKKAKVKFREVDGANGYEVVYSTNKKLKNSRTVTAKGTTAVLKNLKKNKKYYVRVRAYRAGSDGNRVYGAYSGIKSVKVK